jgi:LmbE family N-acetylglucosaminyl deacetylase
LSLAGTIAAGLLAVPLTIVTVFDRTDFAGPGQRGGLDTVSAIRAQEDETFCAAAGVHLERLGMNDACVRHPNLAIAALFERPMLEPAITAELLEHLNELADRFPNAQLLAPAGVGGHMDHTLLAEAARASRWRRPMFYADQPYALRLGIAPIDPVLTIRHAPCALQAKLTAAAAYSSQPAATDLVRLLYRAAPGTPIEWVTPT